MLLTRREAINELEPRQQLDALNVSYQRYRTKLFHDDGKSQCPGKLLVTETHYICDECGEEVEI